MGPPPVPAEVVSAGTVSPALPAEGACVAEGAAWRQRHVTGSATHSRVILVWTLKAFSQKAKTAVGLKYGSQADPGAWANPVGIRHWLQLQIETPKLDNDWLAGHSVNFL